MLKKKICLISSSGGHQEQIMMLSELQDEYEVYFVTEKTEYNNTDNSYYYLNQINRKSIFILFQFIIVSIQSLKIFLSQKPDVIISTGALCVIPTFIIGKLFKKKLIFIESFAKINTPTMTGKFLYKITDIFVVQWETMLKVYPNAKMWGSIY